MALEAWEDGVWVASAPQTLYGIQLGTRMTVVRLPGGGLLLHSVVPMTGPLRTEVEALGPVQHLVLPDLYHHLHVGPWSLAFPKARIHAPPGMAKKRPDLRIDAELSEVPHPDWGGALKPLFISGCGLRETVFLHPQSRTLIVADLVENFHSSDHWLTRLYLRAGGIYGRVGFSRVLRAIYRDRPRARASLERVFAEDFDKVLLTHGQPIRHAGKEAVRLAYDWL
ncbi:MAG: DUF4336 domain-containing protein [Myxococcaceae bacterium]